MKIQFDMSKGHANSLGAEGAEPTFKGALVGAAAAATGTAIATFLITGGKKLLGPKLDRKAGMPVVVTMYDDQAKEVAAAYAAHVKKAGAEKAGQAA